MADQLNTCQVKVSTPFIFDNVQSQRAAETLYESVKNYSTVNAGKTYQFKSDFERMQYKMGLFRRGPCSGS